MNTKALHKPSEGCGCSHTWSLLDCGHFCSRALPHDRKLFKCLKKKKNNLLTIVEAALPYRFYSALADIPKTHHAIYSGEGRKTLKELLINYRAVYA